MLKYFVSDFTSVDSFILNKSNDHNTGNSSSSSMLANVMIKKKKTKDHKNKNTDGRVPINIVLLYITSCTTQR